MSVVDSVILIIIALGGFVGYKKGFLPQLISLVGFAAIMVGAFLLKNPVSEFLYNNCPFFKFKGVLEGVTSINIILYEVVAVVLTAIALWVILKVISIIFNKITDKFNDFFLFEILSQLGGCFLGLLENYIVVFLCLYIASLPFFNLNILKESKFRQIILNETPVLSGLIDESLVVFDEVWSLTDKYRYEADSDKFNLETIDVLLKYKFTTVDSIDILVEKNKIEVDGIETILSKYREEE